MSTARRNAVAACVFVIRLWLGPQPVAGQSLPTRYLIEDLGPQSSRLLNESGHLAGTSHPAAGTRVFLSADGTTWEDSGDLACAAPFFFYGAGFNNAGQVAGGFTCPPSPASDVAFVYTGAGVDIRPWPAGFIHGSVFDINDHGQMVGHSIGPDGRSRAIISSPGLPSQFLLPDALDGESSAISINNDGVAVGLIVSSTTPALSRPFLFDGTLSILPFDGWATAVNSVGHFTGIRWSDAGPNAFIFKGGITYQVPSDSYLTESYAINDADVIVGQAQYDWQYWAFRYSVETGSVDLNTLIDPSTGWVLKSATAINNRGQIVGWGTLNGEYRHFLLTPIEQCATQDGFAPMSASASEGPARIEIIEPCEHELKIGPEPSMTQVRGKAVIKGIDPDPTDSASFNWEAVFYFTTKQKAPMVLTPQTYNGAAAGGQSPSPASLFTTPPPATTPHMRGGELMLKVSTRLPDGRDLIARRMGLRVLGENPPRLDIQAALSTGDASLTTWLHKIACQETRQLQFATDTRLRAFQHKGEPKMNEGGDGGIGVMQITEPSRERLPDIRRWDVLWHWRLNIEKGLEKFEEKIAAARNYPGRLRRSQSYQTFLQYTNVRRATEGLPPLDAVIIRDFQRTGPLGDELIEDAVRAFNGYAGADVFGMELHEFRVRTVPVPTGHAFVIANERLEGSSRVADAIWERVPTSERPASGDPEYLDHVRAKDPTCGG